MEKNTNTQQMFPKKGIIKLIAEFIFELECGIAKNWASSAHKRLFYAQWGLSPAPEWFDHSIDMFYQWPKTNNSLWLERGVYGSLALKGGNLLELSCGDGFNSKHFYAHRSKNVIACDFDPTAIQTATTKNHSANIRFVLADIRTQMPEGKFENIVWDAAIEHFTPDEISSIMVNIKNRLTADGVLSGYTIVEKDDGVKHIHQHEYEFRDMEDLKRFLTPHFKSVKVFETIYPSRHNLYFWASDGTIPFDDKWIHGI
jgi:2-polyprenyl-3-methyl-5-hydroxy-6-metoxy-1,4-benzoquinol methylase